MTCYGYYINLDERGEFSADVRDQADKTIFEVISNPEDGCIDLVEDGFMSDPHDLSGLHEYLVSLGILAQDDELLPADEFELAAFDMDEAPSTHISQPSL
jgi:hypothetical protein